MDNKSIDSDVNEITKATRKNMLVPWLISAIVILIAGIIFLLSVLFLREDTNENNISEEIMQEEGVVVADVNESIEDYSTESIDIYEREEISEDPETQVTIVEYADKELSFTFNHPSNISVVKKDGSSPTSATYYVESNLSTLKVLVYRTEGGPGVGGLAYLTSFTDVRSLDGSVLEKDNGYRIVSDDFMGYATGFQGCVSGDIIDCKDNKYTYSPLFSDEFAIDASTIPLYVTFTVTGNPNEEEWVMFDDIILSFSGL